MTRSELMLSPMTKAWFRIGLAILGMLLAAWLPYARAASAVSGASAIKTPVACRDLDGDGSVSVSDIVLVSAHLGTTNPLYDIDGDGAVTVADLRMLGSCWHQPLVASRRINVPIFTGPAGFDQFAVSWFGQVTPTDNYADVRVGVYYPEILTVHVAIMDRLLWFDPAPSPANLEAWDAVTLYLDLDGNVGANPDANSYRLVGQLWAQSGDNRQATYRGNGTGWVANPMVFSADTTWRGNYPNDNVDDKGWTITFWIPFSSLGLTGPPPEGAVWGAALAVHDRDDGVGTAIPAKIWPPAMNGTQPASWGQFRFGLPTYTPPPVNASQVATIRHGLNGANVVDAAVGGHTTCGDGIDHWPQWGQANYAGYTQFNVQNQYDISDWPCFSKYYVTFPLDAIPPGSSIVSATLTLHQFGGAGGGIWGTPPDSYIQVLRVAEGWSEATLNWNNAPLAAENLNRVWVPPAWPAYPGTPYRWDVSAAAAAAYTARTPLRLAVYSADTEYHSGKYFYTSDTDGAVSRPTLKLRWGVP